MQYLKNKLITTLLTLATILAFNNANADEFDHSIWQGLLQKNVSMINDGHASQVDYGALLEARPLLQQYLSQLSAVSAGEFATLQKSEKLAFLLNAYNAFTVDLVLEQYPKLKSIKDIGSLIQSPWKKRFILLLGETRSLDDIEHGMIRKSYEFNEPRIHFAANCASIGCPALLNEAYIGKKLESQLEAATMAFLSDRSRNRYNTQTKKLEVSRIFKWYQDDFERGWHGWHSLQEFFTHYKDVIVDTPEERHALLAGKLDITFLDYNWKLNKKQ